MLPRLFRLDKDAIAAIFRGGRRSVNGAWLVIARPNHLATTRFGFIANAKIFPTAVERHRAKRVAREAVRFCLSRISPGYDIIIMYRFRPESWDFSHLSSQLCRILESFPGKRTEPSEIKTDNH